MSVFKRLSRIAAIVALGVAMTLPAVDYADARKGGSMGSRGSRTYQAPAATPTSPTASQPIQRSATPYNQTAPSAAAAQGARSGMFGSGFGGALMRGLLIGGLVGMLFGGGLGGLSGMLGLLLQVALIGGAIYLAMRFFASRRQQPAGAGAGFGGNPMNRNGMGGNPMGGNPMGGNTYARDAQSGGSALGGGMAGLGGAQSAPQQPAERKDDIGIKPADFEAFERTLSEVQAAYSREDRNRLGELVTPEMLGYFEQEFRDNAERGVRNQVNDVKLLQGDLAEAWREGQFEYATVAIRYQARDTMRDRQTGALADGSTDELGESTEVWTFIRLRGQPWKLSAIQ
ncbi:membrane protein [Azorhizobium oxalatiphilum]|uniref:Membrane protein n=1 Tax=Azorhizobium oxalatiphilum TaxID=980631 RepID=A0A917C255_9HYPH|nr:TIM44-like domain-containing protein [Azorhizobium oxalatiphilum]GGF67057.1 membrane protein [Azorhizobium oxalatiphilum]